MALRTRCSTTGSQGWEVTIAERIAARFSRGSPATYAIAASDIAREPKEHPPNGDGVGIAAVLYVYE